ncbi:MAG: hypothetical protein DRJ96_07990 [Thermoprotei archaeon]|nr:MAG: hypothetical protein DRJ96_07990 [Thermoprotei archaeon]
MGGRGDQGWLRPLAVLVAASFVVNLGFSAMSPLFPYLVLAIKGVLREPPEAAGTVEAHVGAVELGALMAAFMAARAPVAGLVGFLSDALGKRGVIMLGMGIYTAAALGFLAFNDLTAFVGLRALQGVASAMVWPVAEAYLAEVTPKWSRGKAISIYSSSMLIAQVAGPSLGVAVYKLCLAAVGPGGLILALKAPMALLAATCAVSTITLLLLPPISRGSTRVEGLRGVIRGLRDLPPTVSRSLKVMYINGLVNGLAMGILNTAAVAYVVEEVVSDPLYIGIFFTVFSLVAVPATMLAGWLTDRVRRRKPVALVGYFAGRAAMFLLPLTRSYVLLLAVGVLISMVFSLSAPSMRALQADLAPPGLRGTVFGVQQLFYNSGVLMGALMGGYIVEAYAERSFRLLGYDLTGYIVPFWLAGGMGLLTASLFALYVEEPSPHQD